MKGGCYYLPHPGRVWVTIMVLEKLSGSHSARVRLLDDGTEITIDLRECTLTPMRARTRQGTQKHSLPIAAFGLYAVRMTVPLCVCTLSVAAESNLARLPEEAIHEPELLTILEARAKIDAQQPYTAIGNCLLVVNPLRELQEPALRDIAKSQV